MCVCVLLSVFVCTASVRQPPMFERQKNSGKIAMFNVRLCDIVFVWACLCVCVLLLSVSVCTASVRQPLVRAAKTEVKLRLSMFGCVILFLCELLWACLCVYYCLCLFVQRLCVNHRCSSAKKTQVKLRCSMFGCVILFLCELVYVCVCVLLSVSVCTASVRQPLVRAAKTEVKLRLSMFGCVILFMCELVSLTLPVK